MRKILSKDQIDEIFETSSHQSEACVALYRLAFPEWDELGKIEGWPAVGKEAGLYITRKFMEFDRKHHPDLLSGGLWMNKGFSTQEGSDMGLGPWELSTDKCTTSFLTVDNQTPSKCESCDCSPAASTRLDTSS